MNLVVMCFVVDIGPDQDRQEALDNVEVEINFEGYHVVAKTVMTHEEALDFAPRRP